MVDLSIPLPCEFGSERIEIEYQAATPYTTLWYNNYDYYAGIKATFPAYQQPMAVYSSEVNKTFFVWANGAWQGKSWACIGAFDHTSGQVAGVQKLIEFPDNDGHRNPALHLDGSGYLYVFAHSKSTPTWVKVSDAPYDISAWHWGASIPGTTTYPQPHELTSGEITVFHRAGPKWGWCFAKSTDGFQTVGPTTEVIIPSSWSYQGVYALTASANGVVHLICTVLDYSTQVRRHVWYVKSTDGGTTWTDSSGGAYSLPVIAQQAEKIFDSGPEQVNLQDLRIAPNGKPVALISHGQIPGQWSWKILKDGGVYPIPVTTDRQFDCGGLLIVAADDYRAYLPSAVGQAGCDGGNIEEWRSADGGEIWALHAQLTSDPYNHNDVKVVNEGHSDFRAFWGYGDASYDSPGHLKFLSDAKGVEAIRPGDPYARQVTIRCNGSIVAGPIAAPMSAFITEFAPGSTTVTGV